MSMYRCTCAVAKSAKSANQIHGGKLAAHNRAEGGAEFVVVLPVSGGESRDRVPEAGTGQPSAA